jgi:hypothetical protein
MILLRFLGPRSITSFLRLALDIVYFGLWALVSILVICIITLLSVPNLSSQTIKILNQKWGNLLSIGEGGLVVTLLIYGISLSGYAVLMGWLRTIMETLSKRQVFHANNAIRLRAIGLGLAGLELLSYATKHLAGSLFSLRTEPIYGLKVVAMWFTIIIVFVLAEIFKEGTRLQTIVDRTV